MAKTKKKSYQDDIHLKLLAQLSTSDRHLFEIAGWAHDEKTCAHCLAKKKAGDQSKA